MTSIYSTNGRLIAVAINRHIAEIVRDSVRGIWSATEIVDDEPETELCQYCCEPIDGGLYHPACEQKLRREGR